MPLHPPLSRKVGEEGRGGAASLCTWHFSKMKASMSPSIPTERKLNCSPGCAERRTGTGSRCCAGGLRASTWPHCACALCPAARAPLTPNLPCVLCCPRGLGCAMCWEETEDQESCQVERSAGWQCEDVALAACASQVEKVAPGRPRRAQEGDTAAHVYTVLYVDLSSLRRQIHFQKTHSK